MEPALETRGIPAPSSEGRGGGTEGPLCLLMGLDV